MDFIIGMDGGGTKTRAKITDLGGNVLGIFDGGGSNINSASQEDVAANILSLINSSIHKLGLEASSCAGICLGCAGAADEGNRRILENILKNAFSTNVIVVDDAAILLAVACERIGDMILISGTGSICYGLSHNGCCRTGGWGHIIGDEASAYDIAVRMLKAVMRAYDGRGENTVLTQLILDRLSLNGERELIPFVYRNGNGKREIADLARLLSAGCIANDPVSHAIAKKSAGQLADMVDAMRKKITSENKNCSNSFSIALSGSVILNNADIRRYFSQIIKRAYPNASIEDFKKEAADGAIKIIKGFF